MKHNTLNSWTYFTDRREILKNYLDDLSNIAKFSTLVSGPFGLALLISYLSSTGSPMLAPDSSTVLTLLLIVAGYIFIVFFLGLFVYSPIYTCHVRYRVRSSIKTKNFISSFKERRFFGFLKRGFKNSYKNNDFLLFHGASLFVFIDLALGSLLEFSTGTWLISIIIFMIIGSTTSLLLYKHYKVLPIFKSVYLSKRFERIAILEIIQGGISRAFMALVWSLSVFQLVMFVRGKTLQPSSLSLPYFSFCFVIVMLFIYFAFTNVRIAITRLPFLLLFIAFMFAVYAPSYAGGLALRVLGIGGGIPISVTVRTMLPGTQDTLAKSKTGCLIIKSGSEMILKPLDHPTSEICNPPIFVTLLKTNYDRIPMYSQVEVIPVLQIIQVNILDLPKNN